MQKSQYLPLLLVSIDLLAAFVYAMEGDWRRAIYWIAAATLTLTVTL